MNEKYKKYLPLGTVVLMKGAKKRVMITGYIAKSPETKDKVWDYIGCMWPEGVISADKNLLFDHKNIDKIYAIGYTDEEQKRFMKVIDGAVALKEIEASNKQLASANNTNIDITKQQNVPNQQ